MGTWRRSRSEPFLCVCVCACVYTHMMVHLFVGAWGWHLDIFLSHILTFVF